MPEYLNVIQDNSIHWNKERRKRNKSEKSLKTHFHFYSILCLCKFGIVSFRFNCVKSYTYYWSISISFAHFSTHEYLACALISNPHYLCWPCSVACSNNNNNNNNKRQHIRSFEQFQSIQHSILHKLYSDVGFFHSVDIRNGLYIHTEIYWIGLREMLKSISHPLHNTFLLIWNVMVFLQ